MVNGFGVQRSFSCKVLLEAQNLIKSKAPHHLARAASRSWSSASASCTRRSPSAGCWLLALARRTALAVSCFWLCKSFYGQKKFRNQQNQLTQTHSVLVADSRLEYDSLIDPTRRNSPKRAMTALPTPAPRPTTTTSRRGP